MWVTPPLHLHRAVEACLPSLQSAPNTERSADPGVLQQERRTALVPSGVCAPAAWCAAHEACVLGDSRHDGHDTGLLHG